MRSHFHGGRSLDTRTINMYNRVAAIDYIETHSEMESLILESNLVKQHQPEYNIKLKDDKYFPYLRVDLGRPFPRVEVVRRHKRDGARYFGPYTRPGSLRETLRTLRRVFPFRTCTDYKMRTTKRPCLDYHIRRCAGPCAGAVSPEEYRAMMEELCLFLEGRRSNLVKRLRDGMAQAAEALEFERAARLRDQLRAVEDVMEKQAIVVPTLEDEDAIGYAPKAAEEGGADPARAEEGGADPGRAEDGRADAEPSEEDSAGLVAVAVFQVREGKVIDRAGYFLEAAAGRPGPEIVAAFLKQHYGQGACSIPSRILIPEPLPEDEAEPIGEWLSSLKGSRVQLQHPGRGPRRDLVDLADQNAAILLREERARRRTGREAAYARAAALGDVLGLPSAPERIEGYDVSNIQGREAVGSMVVFKDGRPDPGAYRRFRIRTKTRPDDYAMMREILGRRFRRLTEPGGGGEGFTDGSPGAPPEESLGAAPEESLGPPPDLILIDGGKGHLAAAVAVLGELGLELPVVALAKEQEEVFVPGRSEPLDLALDSPALQLLRHVRDEAHRFAVGYHRLLRRKIARRSELDDVPGVGPVRRTALLSAFGSVRRIREASVEELAAVPGVGKAAARKIWEHFRGSDTQTPAADRTTPLKPGTEKEEDRR